MFNFVTELVESYVPKPVEKSIENLLGSLGAATGSDPGIDQYGNQETLNSLYDNITWVYRSIAFIASNLARVPWKYMRGDKDVTDSLPFNVFSNPNPMQTRYDFLVESFSRLEMQGEMFWELYRAKDEVLGNRVVAIFSDWRSEEVKIVPSKGKFIIDYYERTLNGKPIKYAPEDIFYVKYFNPFSTLRGMTPLRPARHISEADLNATYYNKQFFKQGARPSGVLTTDEKLQKPEQERLEEYLKSKYQSVEQMHQLLVLWGGLKFVPLNTMSMTEMQFPKLKEMSREEIVVAFGLNLEVMGLGRKTFENVKQYRKLAWTEKLIPTNDKILSLVNKDLIKDIYGMDDLEVVADYTNIDALKEERSKKMIDYQKGFQSGAITPNEIRKRVFNLDPILIPEMDSTYLHLNVTNPVDLPDIQMPNEPPKQMTRLFVKRLTKDERTKIWWSKIKILEKHESVLRGIMDDYFNEVHKVISAKIPDIIKTEGDKPSAPPSLLARAKRFFDKNIWQKYLVKNAGPQIATTFIDTASGVMAAEGLLFDATDPYVRNLIAQRIKRFSRFVSETTENHIIKLVEGALQETFEAGMQAQSRAIQEVFTMYNVQAKRGRSLLIARTESMGSANAGTQTALVKGKFARKMWLTSRDDKVRESHIIDGQVVHVNEAFQLADGSYVMFPQDINERCILMATWEPIT